MLVPEVVDMDAEIKPEQVVYTSDGEKLGTIKEVVEKPELTYFRVGVTLGRDYWIGSNWVSHSEVQGGEDRLVLEFPKQLLNNYKLPAPA